MKTKTDTQTKVMELRGQQQYDYLLELLSRAKTEGRASMLKDVLEKIKEFYLTYDCHVYEQDHQQENFVNRLQEELKANLKEKK